MVSFELNEQIDALLGRLRSDNYLLQVLPILSGVHDRLLEISASAFVVDSQRDDSSKLDSHVRLDKKGRVLLKKMLLEIKSISPNKLFVGIETLQKDLRSFHDWRSPENSQPLSLLQTKLEAVAEPYEHFITRTYNYPDAVNSLLAANALKLALESTIDLLILFKENLVPDYSDQERSGESVSVFLSSDLDLSIFVQKLSSLEKMYAELCGLLSIPRQQQRLEIAKVESGSLWVKVFGESRVITLMTKLIEAAAMFVYRNYTTEGKLTGIPRNVQHVRSILDLATKIQEVGFDATLLKEDIEKSAVLISQQLNHLLSNEPSIVVNSNYYSTEITADRKYLGSRVDLLTAGDRSEGADESSESDS